MDLEEVKLKFNDILKIDKKQVSFYGIEAKYLKIYLILLFSSIFFAVSIIFFDKNSLSESLTFVSIAFCVYSVLIFLIIKAQDSSRHVVLDFENKVLITRTITLGKKITTDFSEIKFIYVSGCYLKSGGGTVRGNKICAAYNYDVKTLPVTLAELPKNAFIFAKTYTVQELNILAKKFSEEAGWQYIEGIEDCEIEIVEDANSPEGYSVKRTAISPKSGFIGMLANEKYRKFAITLIVFAFLYVLLNIWGVYLKGDNINGKYRVPKIFISSLSVKNEYSSKEEFVEVLNSEGLIPPANPKVQLVSYSIPLKNKDLNYLSYSANVCDLDVINRFGVANFIIKNGEMADAPLIMLDLLGHIQSDLPELAQECEKARKFVLEYSGSGLAQLFYNTNRVCNEKNIYYADEHLTKAINETYLKSYDKEEARKLSPWLFNEKYTKENAMDVIDDITFMENNKLGIFDIIKYIVTLRPEVVKNDTDYIISNLTQNCSAKFTNDKTNIHLYTNFLLPYYWIKLSNVEKPFVRSYSCIRDGINFSFSFSNIGEKIDAKEKFYEKLEEFKKNNHKITKSVYKENIDNNKRNIHYADAEKIIDSKDSFNWIKNHFYQNANMPCEKIDRKVYLKERFYFIDDNDKYSLLCFSVSGFSMNECEARMKRNEALFNKILNSFSLSLD